jgi:hypothetical protein
LNLEAEDRLKLRLLATVWGISMSDCVSKLVEKAYQAEDTAISGKVKTRIKKIIRRYQG